mgnify:CR=1 FL=1
MHIIALRALREFWEKHPQAETPLRAWYAEASRADWKTPADIKAAHRNASFLPNNRVVGISKLARVVQGFARRLQIQAQVRDGHLDIDVNDTGVGLGHAVTDASTGTGLQNIRERLQLHYGAQARLELLPQAQGGTVARLRLPYRLARQPAAEGPSA